ncbi:MAG: hypothetical protein ABI478_04380 [Propionivibrio sp.]
MPQTAKPYRQRTLQQMHEWVIVGDRAVGMGAKENSEKPPKQN